MPLARGAPVARPITADYAFSQAPTEDELRAHQFAAERLDGILGGGAALPLREGVTRAAQGRISDSGRDDTMMNPLAGLAQCAVGLARLLGDAGDDSGLWVAVERDAAADVATRKFSKRSGAVRDPPLAPDSREASGRRPSTVSDAMAQMRPIRLEQISDWPTAAHAPFGKSWWAFVGLEEIHTLHDHGVASLGLHPDANIAWEHKMLFRVLHHILMLERAAEANTKAPSFLSLHRMIETEIDDTGGLAALDFTQHIAQQAEAEARVVRQQRMLLDELKVHDTTEGDGKAEAAPATSGRCRGPESSNNFAPGGRPAPSDCGDHSAKTDWSPTRRRVSPRLRCALVFPFEHTLFLACPI